MKECHYIIIGEKKSHIIWESYDCQDKVSNFDFLVDALMLINYKNNFSYFSIPDNLLYVDYLLEEPIEKEYSFLKWDNKEHNYKEIHSTSTIKTSKNSNIIRKNKEIENHLFNEYNKLIDFSDTLIKEIENTEKIKKLYEIANDSDNHYCKIARFILFNKNGKDISKEELIHHYGCIQKTANMLGVMLTKLQPTNNDSKDNSKEMRK